jgi:ketosteroid isomerase-like protein
MTTESDRAANETRIRALIDDRTKAVRAKDRVRAASGIAPDILTFDVVNLLQNIGADASSKRVEEWFASFQGPISYDTLDMNITAGDDVAFGHGLCHVSATKTDGKQINMWWRSPIYFRKVAGNWLIPL